MRQFEFSRQDFEAVRKLIYAHAGIALSDAKQDLVYHRLARRIRALGLQRFRDYLDLVRSDGAEWEAFVNALTTNLTSFFRESHHFALLKDFLRTRQERPIVIWSAGCSTGEEPYSIAMTAVETFGSFSAPVEILASDLDSNVLRKAAQGIYPIDQIQKLPEVQRRRFFLKGTGENAGYGRVKPELRAMVRFFKLNLLDHTWPIRKPLDAIFCRNVMIYFDKPTQYRILHKMKPGLKQDGLLFVGHSEMLHHAGDLFRLCGQTVYEHTPTAEREPA